MTHHTQQISRRQSCVGHAVPKGSASVVCTCVFAVLTDQFGNGSARDSLVFSPDGRTLAYVARSGQEWLVVVGHREGERYDLIMEGCPVFSPIGRRLAFGAKRGRKWLVVVDGKEQAEYDGIVANLVFSPDGRHLAYQAGKGGSHVLVVDGRESRACGMMVKDSELVFDGPDRLRVLTLKAMDFVLLDVEIHMTEPAGQ